MMKKGNSKFKPVYYFKQLLNGAEIRNKSEHNRKENHKKSNRIDQHSLQKDERSSSERHEAQGNNIFNDSSYVNTKIKKSNYVLDLTKANDSILPKSAINEQSVCTLGERKNIVNVKHYGSGDNESTEKDKNMCLTGKKIWRERLWKRINFRRMSLKSVKSKRKADIFTKNLSLSKKNTLIAKGGILTELKSEIPILKDYLVLHSNCESINTNQNYSSISLRKDVVYCKPSIRENQDIQQNSKRNEIHKCINCPVIIFPEIEDEMQKNLLNSCLQLIEYLASKLCRSGDNRPISDCNKKSLICDKIHVVKSKYIDALTKVKDKCTQQSDYLRMINETFLKMENDVSYNETNCQTMEWNIERAKSNKKQVHQCEQVSKTLINIYDKRRRALPPNAAETIKEKQFIGNLVEKNLKHNKANTEEWQHDDYKCRKADSFECSANACKACGDINEPKVQSNNVRINSYDCLTSHFDCECMNAKIIKSNLIPTLSKDFKQTLFSGKNVKKNLANSNKCLKLHDVCRCTNDEAFIKHTKITDTCNDFNQQKVIANTLKNNSYKCFKSLDDCNRINDEVMKSSKRSRICKNIKQKVFGNHIKKNRKDNKAYTKECSKLQDDCRCINVNEQKQDFSNPVLKNCTDTKANIKCLKLRNDCKCKNAKIIESNEISSTSKNLTKKQFLGRNERLKTHCDSICQKVVGLQFKKVANGYRGSNLNPIRSGLKSKNVKKNTNEYFKYLNDCKCLNDGMIETCKLCRTRKSIGKKVFFNNVKKNRRHNETTNECSKLQNECRCINTDVSEACGDVNLRQVGVNHFQKKSRKYLKSDNNCKCIHSGKIESSNLPTICKDIKQIDDVDKNVQKNVEGKSKRWLHCNFTLRHRPKRKCNVIHCKAKYTDSGSKRDAGTLESSTHKKKYRKKTKKHVRMRLHSDTFLQVFKFKNCNIRKDAIRIAVVKKEKYSDECKNKNINKCVRSSKPRYKQYSTCLSPKIISTKEKCENNSAKDINNTRNIICSPTGPIKYKNYDAQTTMKKIVCCGACSTNFPKQCYTSKTLPSCKLNKNKHIELLCTRKKSLHGCTEPHCSRLPPKCKSAWKGTWREYMYCAFQCLCKKIKKYCCSESKCTYKSGNNKKHTEHNDFNCNDLLFLNTPTKKPLFRETHKNILKSCCFMLSLYFNNRNLSKVLMLKYE